MLRLHDPVWMLAAAVAIPLCWMGYKCLSSMTRARLGSAIFMRAALCALLAAALAGAHALQRTDRVAVVAVVDVSESVRRFASVGDDTAPDAAVRAVNAWLAHASESMAADDVLGVVGFDGEARAVRTPSPGPWDESDAGIAGAGAVGTSIQNAVELAVAMLPPNAAGRVVLISDGAETSGQALEAAQRAGRGNGGATIDVLPIDIDARGEVAVEFVDAPPRNTQGEPITNRIGIRAAAPTTGELRLRREGTWLDLNGDEEGVGRRVTLREGLNIVPVTVRPPRRGRLHRWEAVLTPDAAQAAGAPRDTVESNNAAHAVTITLGKPAVLVLTQDQDAAQPLVHAIEDAGLDVFTSTPQRAPSDTMGFHAYDLVVLHDVAADALSAAAQQAAVRYVQRLGGGLLVIGGRNSFAAGGWRGSPIEPALPVLLDLKEEIATPSNAVMLVLDSSGSMGSRVMGGSRTQQAIANEAAAMAIRTLDKADHVGVLAFDNATSRIVRLGPNDNPDGAAKVVQRISPSGGTNMYPALLSAGEALLGSDAQVKHVIILSDGQSQGEPQVGINAAKSLRAAGVSVSTIAVGTDADTQTLSAIAAAGGGQHYNVIDPYTLPQIFIRDIRIVRKPPIRESPFTPRSIRGNSPVLTGLEQQAWPTLGGVNLTTPRPEPGVRTAMVTDQDEPLLAHWRFGLGQVAVWTSDTNVWAAQWVRWKGFMRFWGQTAKVIARSADNPNATLLVDTQGDKIRVRLDAYDDNGAPRDAINAFAVIAGPDGTEQRTPLEQVAPGAYTAQADARRAGSYVVMVTQTSGGEPLAPVVSRTTKSQDAEFRRLESDRATLEAVADATGGRVLSLDDADAATLFDRGGMRATYAMEALWPSLLIAAIAVYLLDIATRKVAWDRGLLDRALRERGGTPAPAGASLAALRAARTNGGTQKTMRAGGETRPKQRKRRGKSPLEKTATPAGTQTAHQQTADAALTDAALKAPTQTTHTQTHAAQRKAAEQQQERRGEGLLAAKRRARARMEGRGAGQSGDSGPAE